MVMLSWVPGTKTAISGTVIHMTFATVHSFKMDPTLMFRPLLFHTCLDAGVQQNSVSAPMSTVHPTVVRAQPTSTKDKQ